MNAKLLLMLLQKAHSGDKENIQILMKDEIKLLTKKAVDLLKELTKLSELKNTKNLCNK